MRPPSRRLHAVPPAPAAAGRRRPSPPGRGGDASAHVAELLVNAAAALTAAADLTTAMTPLGVPVRRGRVALGRARHLLTDPADPAVPVAVAVGFGTAAWLGAATAAAPSFGRLAHRETTTLDARGRLRLSARVRLWLRLPDPDDFALLLVPAPSGGVFAVPVDDLTARWAAVEAL